MEVTLMENGGVRIAVEGCVSAVAILITISLDELR